MPCAALSGERRPANRPRHHDSVAYALDHRESAVNYAMQFARDMDPELAEQIYRHVRE